MALPQPQRRYDNSSYGGGFTVGRLRLWTVNSWLIAIAVGFYLIDELSAGLLMQWGSFSLDTAIFHGQIWRFLTFQFLHWDPMHLLFNMLALYFFGPIIEARLGPKRYLAFYLICGICGALFYLALGRLGFVDTVHGGLAGASAGIFGVLVAIMNVEPHMLVRLLLPPVLMKIRTLALIFLALAVVIILSHGPNAGGEAAHLGGAFAGWILINNVHWLNVFDRTRRGQRFWRPGDPAANFFRKDVR